MKKIIAAAVASTVSIAALADISITGNAKYEYFNSQTGTSASTNKGNTELNLSIAGKKGDSGAVINLEFNTHGNVDSGDTDTVISAFDTTTGSVTSAEAAKNAQNVLNVEDMYMYTKVGDVSVKGGNWATGTTALLGEIDEGGRATNKIDLRTTIGGATVYVGNSGNASTGQDLSDQVALNNNMYAGVVMNVGGATVELKQLDEDTDAFGIKGNLAGVDYRLEQKSDTTANGDVTFAEVKAELSGVKLGYAVVDADKAGKITESDSSIFAVEAATSSGAISTATGVKQVMASTSIDGNTVTFKSGTVEGGLGATTDLDFTQVGVSRALASGANAVVTYTSKDATGGVETDTLEVEVNVSF
jgi:hypothetical protein